MATQAKRNLLLFDRQQRAELLQRYWEQLSEKERASRANNQQLLDSLNRFEKHAAKLEQRTQRIKALKEHYFAQLERRYPGWSALMSLSISNSQQQFSEAPVQAHAFAASASPSVAPLKTAPSASHVTQPKAELGPSVAEIMAPPVASLPQAVPTANVSSKSLSNVAAGINREQEQVMRLEPRPTREDNSQHRRDPIRHGEPGSPRREPTRSQRIPPRKHTEHSEKSEAHTMSTDRCSDDDDEDTVAASSELVSNAHSIKVAVTVNKGSTQPVSGTTPTHKESLTQPSLESQSSQSHVVPGKVSRLQFSGLQCILEALREASLGCRIYEPPGPGEAVKSDVIRSANEGNSLQHHDLNTLSIVVLEQTPLLVAETRGQCLLPDAALARQPETVTRHTVRSEIPANSRDLWDALVAHWSYLVERDVIPALTLSKLFARHLFTPLTSYPEKAVSVLEHIIIKAADETQITASMSLNSPRKTPRLTPPTSTREPVTSVSPLRNESSVGDFLYQSAPTEDLSQSAAYQQLLGQSTKLLKTEASLEEKTYEDPPKKPPTPIPESAPATDRSGYKITPRSPHSDSSFSDMGYIPSALEKSNSQFSSGRLAESKKLPRYMRSESELEDESESERQIFQTPSSVNTRGDADDFDFYD